MNSRQAAKAAAKRIEECERVMALNKADIQDYNRIILDMICGESPCPYCEDWNECQLDAKAGKGCSEWMLRMQRPEPAPEGGDPDGQEAGNTEPVIFGVEE